MDRKTERGMTLVEVMVATAIVGMLSAMTMIAFNAVWSRWSLAVAASQLRQTIAETRALAIQIDEGAAMKFRLNNGEWTYTVYVDGDRDGIRSDDILKGIDKPQGPPRAVRCGRATIGLPAMPISDPVDGGQLSDRAAIRFGNSSLCSFSRDGDVTNGSIVLTDGTRVILIVVNGAIRRISTYHYDGTKWSTREL